MQGTNELRKFIGSGEVVSLCWWRRRCASWWLSLVSPRTGLDWWGDWCSRLVRRNLCRWWSVTPGSRLGSITCWPATPTDAPGKLTESRPSHSGGSNFYSLLVSSSLKSRVLLSYLSLSSRFIVYNVALSWHVIIQSNIIWLNPNVSYPLLTCLNLTWPNVT